ncbi:MAG: hypothetical protein IT453_02375 [Planctomycetes bacterium]|nr:hypothetical protein [Planctomycetota bacterium]
MNSILSLVLPFFAASPAPANAPLFGDAPAVQAPARDPLLGGPVKVDGKEIPELSLKRFLAHSVGWKQSDRDKFEIILTAELERRQAAGEDVSRLRPTKEDIDAKIEKDRVDFLLKYPTLDFATEVGRAYLSLDLYREQAAQAMLFDRVFTPEDPDQWPPLTREIVTAEGQGTGLIDDAKESYEARKQRALDEGLPEIPPDDPIWVEYLRGIVIESLLQFSAIETNAEKLPADVLLTIDGRPVTVEQVYQRIRPHVTVDLAADARKFLAIKALVEADLAKKGVLESRADFEKNFAPEESFQDTMMRFQMLAMSVQGFPSMEAWVDYTRWFRSFQKTIADDLKDDAKLLTVLGPCNAITAAAKVNVEVILASAYDDAHVRWKDNGWAYAEQRAKEIRKELDAGADWKTTLENKSEFWDPPMPEIGQKPQFGFNFKGMFGEQTRNQLLTYMRESEYRIFLDASSVTDYIFFKQRPGSIEGPLKGARGYYISRVTGTTPPTKPLNMKDPKHRELVETHYSREKFNAYVQDLLAKAIAERRVEGL